MNKKMKSPKKPNSKIIIFALLLFYIIVTSCSTRELTNSKLNMKEQNIADSIGISYNELQELKQRKLYTFSEKEVDIYLKYLSKYEPDINSRVKHLGLKNIGQPYELYLLGEFPFSIYDTQPLYCLEKSDCVVFVEHTYAMALAHDWNSFFKILQRIRYKNGNISLVNRNHYANMDWNPNNSWLVTDITDSLGGLSIDTNKTIYNKKHFFTQWNLNTNIPVDSIVWSYIPAEKIDSIKSLLQTGDLVQIVRGTEKENGKWVGHFGLIILDKNGNVNLLHSTPPKVKIQSLMSYVNNGIQSNIEKKRKNVEIIRKNKKIKKYNDKLKNSIIRKHIFKLKKIQKEKIYFYGLRFLRLRTDPLKNLKCVKKISNEQDEQNKQKK